jgi:hypothetical protein
MRENIGLFKAKRLDNGEEVQGYYWTNEYNSLDNIQKYADKVFRHELTHAFLFESGLACYGGDEKIVDWIAAQYPKLKEVFERLKVEK